jgi:hypothetical protein
LATVTSSFAQEGEPIALDRAIRETMNNLAARLPEDTTVAVLNFSAPTKELSNYIIEELTGHAVKNNSLKVVDRRNLELLQQELNFQMSGEVSDETVQAVGKKIGAGSIISGSFTSLGNDIYRFLVQAINVETAVIQGQQTAIVRMDSSLASLLHISEFSTGRRVGAGFLNIMVGLGSFTMKDWLGGGILVAGYGLAAGLIVWELAGLTYDDPAAGVPGAIGIGVAAATIAFGFIRPIFFHNNFSKHRIASVNDGIYIAIIPDTNGIKAVKMTYTYSF